MYYSFSGFNGCNYFKRVQLNQIDTIKEKRYEWIQLCQEMQADNNLANEFF